MIKLLFVKINTQLHFHFQMGAFSCLILAGVLLHLVLSDVSHTIDSNRQNVKSEQAARSNYYQPPQGYDYSGSYSTVSPENKAQYVTPASSKTSYDSYPSGQVMFLIN